MRLLYVHDTEIKSEEANLIQVVQMCHALANNKVEVSLALPELNNRGMSYYRDTLSKKVGVDINFSILPFKKITIWGKLNFFGGYFGVKNLLHKEKADVCYTRRPLFVNLALKSNLPVIFESHNYLLYEQSKVLNDFLKLQMLRESKQDLFLKFITISNALAGYWCTEGIPKEKVIVNHDGFDHNKFLEKKDRSLARRIVGLPADQKIVAYVGSLYPDRGIENIFRLAEHFKSTLFVVVGGPERQRRHFSSLISKRKINNVILKGRVPHGQVSDFLFAADVLLMIWTKRVRWIDYFSPLKVFEYMAAGRVIVGHGFPTIREVLEDGKSALLADPECFNELKGKLKRALECESMQALAERARRLAFSRYSWDQRAKSIIRELPRVG